MTNEEMQKAMEFILNQQAQASAKIDALADAQKEAQSQFNERWGRTEEGIRALLSIAEIHEREIGSLGDKIASISETVAQVSENGRATDERLNALINTVERQISEGRNGKS